MTEIFGYEQKALATTTNSRAELNDIFLPLIENQLNDKTTLWGLMPKKQNNGGDYVRFRSRTARNASAASYAETDTITTGNTTRKKNSTPIKLVKAGWEVTGLMQVSSMQAGIGDILAEEIKDATLDFQSAINVQMFGDGTGNGGLDLLGLKILVDDGVLFATIYGVNRTLAGNEYLKATVDSATPLAGLTLTKLRDAFAAVEIKGAKKRDLAIVTTYAIKDKILGLMDAAQRIISTDPRLGFEGIPTFDGVPIYADKDCTAAHLYVLDMSTFGVYISQSPAIEELPSSKDSRSGYIKMYAEFICTQPENNYKFTALA